jgi:D-tyrosyl-tRNA(Tyr) deacylase
MRLVIQRVSSASVKINNVIFSNIGQGLLVLLGIEEEDNETDILYLSQKLIGMRIFSDEEGKMNLDVKQINGDVLIVSQFTLLADTKKGNRPSYIKAARPEKAIPLYEKFIAETETLLEKPCKTGQFGADMQVELINDGPVTIIIDSKSKS